MSDPLVPDTQEGRLLHLMIKDAVRDGFDEHLEKHHIPLENKLDSTSSLVKMGAGVFALGAILLAALLVRFH